MSIPGCNLDTAISAFRKGLKTNSDLYKKLTKYLCQTMEDVLNKAGAQIKWEDDEANQPSTRPSRSNSAPDRRNTGGSQSSSNMRRDTSSKGNMAESRSHPYSRPEQPRRSTFRGIDAYESR